MTDLIDVLMENLEEGVAFISYQGALIKNNEKMEPYLIMEGFSKIISELAYIAAKRGKRVTAELTRDKTTLQVVAVPSNGIVAVVLSEVNYSSILPDTLRQGLEKDLEFAKSIQRSILPLKKEYGNLTLDYIYEPSQSLSGDIFDIFNIDDNNIGMYVADVAGHGIAAAMMTMFVKQIFRYAVGTGISPAITLANLYDKFYSLNLPIEKYITCFYAVYNIDEEILSFSNAGHNCPPLVYDGEKWFRLDLSGYPIFRLFPKVRYREESISFKEKFKLFLYTDGITENISTEGELFGEERLYNLIRNNQDDILGEIEKIAKSPEWMPNEDDYAAILIERI